MIYLQGYAGPRTNMDCSLFNPFNNKEYFHPYCAITNYSDQTNVEDCWLGDNIVAGADLNTSRTDVQNIWYSWVGSLVSNYSSESITYKNGAVSDPL